MLGVRPERMLTFSRELQDMLGFKVHLGAGHIFAQDPRLELERQYGSAGSYEAYLERRNALHANRMAATGAAAGG